MRGQMKNFYYRRFQIGFVRYNNTLYDTKYHMLLFVLGGRTVKP